ncbi:MAG: phage Gp37/Gp68 family protein [Pseudomonadota bacterium]
MTSIEWTDDTVNFWWGCTKVGPGCDNCYAEALNAFRGTREWGPGAPRRKIKGAVAKIRRLRRTAAKFEARHGRRRRVFCQSMSDTFDNEVDAAWRDEALQEIENATSLDIQMLTKRVSNVEKMVPGSWKRNWPAHVQLIVTVVNQQEADRDVPRLLALKARFGIKTVGLSMEPLLGPVDLTAISPARADDPFDPFNALSGGMTSLDWIIVGGESGKGARPMHPDWARSIRDHCAAASVLFFFKQWGNWSDGQSQGEDLLDGAQFGAFVGDRWIRPFDQDFYKTGLFMFDIGKKGAGRLLDGRTHDSLPRTRSKDMPEARQRREGSHG